MSNYSTNRVFPQAPTTANYPGCQNYCAPTAPTAPPVPTVAAAHTYSTPESGHAYLQINSKSIIIDALYQRNLDQHRVDSIVRNFDPNMVNPIKVSYRDRKYYCFDGQHTLSALKSRNNGHDLVVECKVYYGLTQYDEAMYFERQMELARSVNVLAKFRSMFNRGDPEILEMVRTAEALGLIIDFTQRKGRNRIMALAKLYTVYSNTTLAEYTNILHTLKHAWNDHDDAFRSELLGGMWIFYRTYRDQFDPAQLLKKLSKTAPMIIVREGKVSSTSGDRKYARQILNAYNSGSSKNRLADKL